MPWKLPHIALPPDPIFAVAEAFKKDPRKEKINLSIGIYRDRRGEPFIMPVIKKWAKKLSFTHFEYYPMGGHPAFLDVFRTWFFAEKKPSSNILLQQSIGGTHGLKLLAELFLQRASSSPTFLLAVPTWGNHKDIFKAFSLKTFPHLTPHYTLNLKAYTAALETYPKSILLLHGGAAHNPTGINLTIADLEALAPIIQKNRIFVIIDAAYIGLAEGLTKDKAWLHKALKLFPHCAIVFSFSKNATLYNQRLGVLLLQSGEEPPSTIASHLHHLVRASISNFPAFGADIMHQVFLHAVNRWEEELEAMRQDIEVRRSELLKALPASFQFLRSTKGLFALTGFSPERVAKLKEDFAIYMPPNGRINIAGIKEGDIPRIAEAFRSVKS